jgi:hypothetical protein
MAIRRAIGGIGIRWCSRSEQVLERSELILRSTSLTLLQKELAIIAGMLKLGDELKAEFAQTKSALETAKNDLPISVGRGRRPSPNWPSLRPNVSK